jgi:aspartate/methionine/tyrosine aminotransferase
MTTLENNARTFASLVSEIPGVCVCASFQYYLGIIVSNLLLGLSAVMPTGAMYCMVHIALDQFPQFEADVEWVQALLDEQQVFVLPGACFTMPGYFRAVLCAPEAMMRDAARRMTLFCDKHRIK